jgi:hypothetical protein
MTFKSNASGRSGRHDFDQEEMQALARIGRMG